VPGKSRFNLFRVGLSLILPSAVICSAFAQASNRQAETIFRSEGTEVRGTFSATDQTNRVVANVQASDFAVVDKDRVVRDFRSFTRSEYMRLDVAILVDASESTTRKFHQELLLVVVLLGTLAASLFAENRAQQEGTIVRMRMADCIAPQHAFMSAMSGVQAGTGESCPEYVLVTKSVVYVIVGKSSDYLVPLAESTFFHLQKNEVLIRVDDARRESRFHVKEMVLRPEWERNQQMLAAATAATMRRHLEGTVLVNAVP
jgi:hypothetical protein